MMESRPGSKCHMATATANTASAISSVVKAVAANAAWKSAWKWCARLRRERLEA